MALVLWGTDAVNRLRAGAQTLGMAHAAVVNAISDQLGGGFMAGLNAWVAGNPVAANLAAWYYILFQGAVTALVGLVLIGRRVPSLPLHRNALIACNLVGLVAFWFYPVAPPRMLPGYHDVTATAVPLFTSLLEGNAAAEYASLPSLHVAWALWVALALGSVLRRKWQRAVAWLYPAATITDVLATANHYLLDVITAPAVLLTGYLIAASPALARRLRSRLGAPATESPTAATVQLVLRDTRDAPDARQDARQDAQQDAQQDARDAA